MSTYAAVLARHVVGLREEDVPTAVRKHAVRLITDTIGDGMYGARTPQGQMVYAEAAERYRDEGADVWGRAGQLDAAGAALVNAAQAHAYELDDYLPAGKTHPGTVIVPAALAVARRDTTGSELVTAVVAGYDVMCRVALALGPNSARGRGFHMTGLTGPFGAAAVAGRLLGLDEATLTSALGIAASCSAGIFAFSAEGAMTKPLHAGRAAEAGIVAVRLAQRGFHGPSAALEAADGGLLNAVSDDAQVDELTRDLGVRFDLARVAIKPYPCCGSIHSSIDAVLDLQRFHRVAATDVDSILVHNARGVILQCGFPYSGQGGPLEAQMSLQYCVAAAMVDGRVGLGQFTDSRRRDRRIVELADRVAFDVDPEIDAIYPARFPARVEVRLNGGATRESRVAAPLGTPENPIDDEALAVKFTDLTRDVMPPGDQDQVLATMKTLDSEVKVEDLRQLLREAVGAGHPVPTRVGAAV